MAGDRAGGRIVVPISALEHYSYCPRQSALIHVEQTFDENVFTVRGSLAHKRVESGVTTTPNGVLQMRSVPLWSDEHGLIGKADVVEFLEGVPVPIEHKSGEVGDHAAIQLCAQALCLEEMLQVPVPTGFLYSYATKRRKKVDIGEKLRARTLSMTDTVRRIIEDQQLPPPVNDARCPNCSLINACLPTVVGEPARIRGHQGALFVPASDPSGGLADD